ncbi:MAG: archaellin/type IV pilin N-terminal domain-containing protein [Candidatus Methanoperedens sp.]
MKANRTNILKNDTGDVGIGTLIIFIAMVLVAAVAAAVLIQTSGVLQQKAQQTGKEATAQVSSNLQIISVVGNVTGTNNIDNFTVTVTLSAGGNDIDFGKVVAKYIDNSKTDTSTYGASVNATAFTYDESNRFVGTQDAVLSAGELGTITIHPTTPMAVRGKATIEFIPETGTMVVKDIIAPSTFGGQTQISLFP